MFKDEELLPEKVEEAMAGEVKAGKDGMKGGMLVRVTVEASVHVPASDTELRTDVTPEGRTS